MTAATQTSQSDTASTRTESDLKTSMDPHFAPAEAAEVGRPVLPVDSISAACERQSGKDRVVPTVDDGNRLKHSKSWNRLSFAMTNRLLLCTKRLSFSLSSVDRLKNSGRRLDYGS